MEREHQDQLMNMVALEGIDGVLWGLSHICNTSGVSPKTVSPSGVPAKTMVSKSRSARILKIASDVIGDKSLEIRVEKTFKHYD